MPTAEKRPRQRAAKRTSPTTEDLGRTVRVAAPNFQTAIFHIRGNTPYVQNAFSKKVLETLRAAHAQGTVAKNKRQRKPKDFDALYLDSLHKMRDGSFGIPAPAFRNAAISAGRVAGYVMTKAKLSLFVVADGFDTNDGTPLVRITKGKPARFEAMARNADFSPDVRVRAKWEPGWEAKVKMRWDADQFSLDDVASIMMRIGMQVGVGEGRPDSKKSAGMGWGTFDLVGREEQ